MYLVKLFVNLFTVGLLTNTGPTKSALWVTILKTNIKKQIVLKEYLTTN